MSKHNTNEVGLFTDAHGDFEIAHVKLDKCGKTVRVVLDDCTFY